VTSFATEFLGCKVSMTDAQQVRERLAADGHREADPEEAAVRVVNTCCVTAEAVAKWPMTRRLWNNTVAMLGPIL